MTALYFLCQRDSRQAEEVNRDTRRYSSGISGRIWNFRDTLRTKTRFPKKQERRRTRKTGAREQKMGKENFPEITEIMSEDSKRESGERIKTWEPCRRGKDTDPSWSWPQGTKLTDRSRAAERLPAPLLACVLLTQLRKPYPPSRTRKTVPIHAHAGGSESHHPFLPTSGLGWQ